MTIHSFLTTEDLILATQKESRAKWNDHGVLILDSTPHTGRSAQDKYMVETEQTKLMIDWSNNLNKMSIQVFDKLKSMVMDHFQHQNSYRAEYSAGFSKNFNLGVELTSTQASAHLFAKNMFFSEGNHVLGKMKVYHAPLLKIDHTLFSLRAPVCIALNYESKEVIIFGTAYLGEIKKSVFSMMNILLPSFNVLPMHAGANADQSGQTSVFFGLSGTGKTTLSTDTGTKLIGDDEIGLSDQGIFNFENGCYAKTQGLKFETEPEIYQTTLKPGTILENVYLDKNNQFDFENSSITENGRASYALSSLPNITKTPQGSIPKHFFFLSADAFGVLPAVASLNATQAKDFFLLGYTAKLAGTEIGLKEPKATFSTCFGAPFMMLHREVYSSLLCDYIKKYDIKVWLINTGWFGGAYGEGKRFPLSVTRQIIRSIKKNNGYDLKFQKLEPFGFNIPLEIPEIDNHFLNPLKAWGEAARYQHEAQKLKELFDTKIK
jgi:phosphoenolpyruvate carboxykinase (ATP)